eukprot:gene11165-3986_t
MGQKESTEQIEDIFSSSKLKKPKITHNSDRSVFYFFQPSEYTFTDYLKIFKFSMYSYQNNFPNFKDSLIKNITIKQIPHKGSISNEKEYYFDITFEEKTKPFKSKKSRFQIIHFSHHCIGEVLKNFGSSNRSVFSIEIGIFLNQKKIINMKNNFTGLGFQSNDPVVFDSLEEFFYLFNISPPSYLICLELNGQLIGDISMFTTFSDEEALFKVSSGDGKLTFNKNEIRVTRIAKNKESVEYSFKLKHLESLINFSNEFDIDGTVEYPFWTDDFIFFEQPKVLQLFPNYFHDKLFKIKFFKQKFDPILKNALIDSITFHINQHIKISITEIPNILKIHLMDEILHFEYEETVDEPVITQNRKRIVQIYPEKLIQYYSNSEEKFENLSFNSDTQILDFEKRILEIEGKLPGLKGDVIMRIPLDNRELFEFYIENGFNSMFELKLEKSLKINKKLERLCNFSFQFQ